MSLISIVLILVVVGLLLWLLESQVPMDATVRKIIRAVVIIAIVLWLLQVFGLIGSIRAVRVG